MAREGRRRVIEQALFFVLGNPTFSLIVFFEQANQRVVAPSKR
jgi:hypothetical protein